MTVYDVWVAIAVLFIGQIGLLLLLMRRKQKLSRMEEEREEQYEALADDFSSYMIDPANTRFVEVLSSMSHRDSVLEKLLNGYVAVTKGGVTSPLVQELSGQFLAERYERQLRRNNWAMRMNTLHYIEDFHMTSLAPLLLEKLRSATRLDQETQQLIRTLASLDEQEAVSALSRYSEVPVRLYVEVFRRLAPQTAMNEIETVLTEEEEQEVQKHAALSFIGMARWMSFLPLVEKELKNPNGEIRIQALKALLRLQYISEPALLVPFLYSSSWSERMFASRLAGVVQLSRYKERLSELLGDSAWWVRYAAAEALARFPDGDILLEHVSAHHPDRFARDMATQWKLTLVGSER